MELIDSIIKLAQNPLIILFVGIPIAGTILKVIIEWSNR